jgi:hypothetical protein
VDKQFSNVIFCFDCDCELQLLGDRVEEVFDIPDHCPECGTEWNNVNWFASKQDAATD